MMLFRKDYLKAASLHWDRFSYVVDGAIFTRGYKYGKRGYRLKQLSGPHSSGPAECFVTDEECEYVKTHGYLPPDVPC